MALIRATSFRRVRYADMASSGLLVWTWRRVRLSVIAAGVLGAVVTACGASISAIPAAGEVAGHRIRTTVDSDAARYYLDHFLAGRRENAAVDALIEQAEHSVPPGLPTRDILKQVAQAVSVDYAALVFARRVLEDPSNQRAQALYGDALARVESDASGGHGASPPWSEYVVLLVPGWVYRSDPGTGADLAKPRAVLTRLGVPNRLVEIPETGTVEQNAAVIAEAIRREQTVGKPIILVSASSGGSAVAQALGEVLTSDDARGVRAWLNVGGILYGSPLADDALRWPKRWAARLFFAFNGWDVAAVESMTARASRARMSRLTLPAHVCIVNYIGIPLSGDISRRARDGYRALRREGPNDGLALLPDLLAPDSVTVADLGLDHFFQDPRVEAKIQALTETVMTLISLRRGTASRPLATCSRAATHRAIS